MLDKTSSIRMQFAETMLELGKINPALVVVVGDISHFNLQPFAKACPGRYFNIGICESATISVAAGLSKVGLTPVVHTIAPFLVERAFEQLKLDFCYQGLSGNIVTVGSAFDYSNLGCTHHCYGDFALLKTLDGSAIYYPATNLEFDVLFRSQYEARKLNLFRVPSRSHSVEIPGADIVPGKAVKVRNGQDITIVVTGPQLQNAVQAADRLANQCWEAEILYVHTIRPLDTEAIKDSVSKTRRVLVVEEHMRSGGLGDDVMRVAINIGVEFSSLSIPDKFVHDYGSYDQQCDRLGLSEQGIIRQVETFFRK